MFKCCFLSGLITAVFFGLAIHFGRMNDLLVGFAPILVNEHLISELTIPNLEGKTMIITGSNAGLGRDTAKHLAINGAKVVMACRSMDRCNTARQSILKEVESAASISHETGIDYSKFRARNLVPMELDLGSLSSIKSFSELFLSENVSLHSLILNAGVMHSPYGLTSDGIEQQIGVNHFGHFYLTKLLLPLLEASEPSTVVSVSSVAHHFSYPSGVKLSLEDLNDEASYDPILAYGQSKLANVLFTQELAEIMSKKGRKVYVNSLHPGFVNSELARHYSQDIISFFKSFALKFPNTIAFESHNAALLEVYVAASQDIYENQLNGKYFVQLGEVANVHQHAQNTDLQKQLWKLSEEVLAKKGY